MSPASVAFCYRCAQRMPLDGGWFCDACEQPDPPREGGIGVSAGDTTQRKGRTMSQFEIKIAARAADFKEAMDFSLEAAAALAMLSDDADDLVVGEPAADVAVDSREDGTTEVTLTWSAQGVDDPDDADYLLEGLTLFVRDGLFTIQYVFGLEVTACYVAVDGETKIDLFTGEEAF